MKLVNQIAILFLLFLLPLFSMAQQEELYTQFMFNKLRINPAYAGVDNSLCITGVVREHWMGFPGNSKAQALSVNFPRVAKDRVGLALNLSRNSIGVQQKLTLEGVYAYRFPFAGGNFSMGISVSGRQYNTDFSDPDLDLIHPFYEDAAIEEGEYSKAVFNAGFGMYFNNEYFYLGAGIPRLIRADIDLSESPLHSIEMRHIYFMTGFAIPIDRRFTFMPQLLLKLAENSPMDIDVNLGFEFDEKYYAALTARSGGSSNDLLESLDLLVGLQLNKQMFLGVAYDITLSPLRSYENGSVEILLNYCFGKRENDVFMVSPRFF